MPPDDDAPDEEIGDDVTPPAHEIPPPPPRASPFELLQYDVRVTRQEARLSAARAGRRLGALESAMRKLIGEDGTNGRVGNLVAALGGLKRIGWAAMLMALGGILSAAVFIYDAGGGAATERLRLEQVEQRSLSNEAKAERLENELLRLRFPSAFPPALAPGVSP